VISLAVERVNCSGFRLFATVAASPTQLSRRPDWDGATAPCVPNGRCDRLRISRVHTGNACTVLAERTWELGLSHNERHHQPVMITSWNGLWQSWWESARYFDLLELDLPGLGRWT
jgi:hypothetical protein